MKSPAAARGIAQLYGLVGLLALGAFILAYQFVEPAPPDRLVMASGRSDGAYHGFAKRYRERLAEDGIELVLRETEGSLENLDLLARGEVDVILAQGGTGEQGSSGTQAALRSLGSLYYEPLWIFVRGEMSAGRLDDLAGRRIAWGGAGSGTRAVAQLLFADAGVEVTGLPLAGGDAVRALEQGEVEAVLVVAGMSSPTVQRLLLQPEMHLMSLQRAEAFARRYRFLAPIELPSGVLSPRDNRPPQDVTLLAPAASLVTTEALHPALAGLLLLAAREIHAPPGLISERDAFPSPQRVDFPLTEAAERFYRRGPPLLQRYLPFWAAVLVDRLWVMLLPVIGLLIPLSRILPPAYRWRVRKRIYCWYDELQGMDLRAEREPSAALIANSLQRLDAIEDEVREIEVPLPYGQELYLLRQHIELLREQLLRRGRLMREMQGAGE